MQIEPIPGFDVLKFKEEAQAQVQAELAGLTPGERIRKIREGVENGPFGERWKQLCAAKRAEAMAALQREEEETREGACEVAPSR